MEVSWHCTSELRKLQSVPKEGGLSPCPQSTFFLPSHQTLPLPVSAPLRPATLSPRLMGPDTDRDPQECHTLGGCSNFSTPIIQMWKLRLGGDHDSRHSSWGLSQLPLYRCTNSSSGDTMTPDIPPGDKGAGSGSWSKVLSTDRHPSHPQQPPALTPSLAHKPWLKRGGLRGEKKHLCQMLPLRALTSS